METSIDRLFSKGIYDPEVFALDMKKMESYYRSLGYLDAKVSEGQSYFSEDKEWLYLEIKVDEGPLYVIDSVVLEGNEIFSTRDLMSRMSSRVGTPFTDFVRMEIAESIEKAYGEVGRVFTRAKVEVHINENQPHVDIDVSIVEGEEVFLRDVRIQGNNKTREVVVRRELEFYPGERINTKLIDRSKRNLANLGFFSINEIDIVPTDEEHMADVVVRVEEKETGSINFALGFSSVESIFGQIKYTQRNFDWRNREKGVGSFFSGQGYIGDGQNLSVTINTGSETRRFNIDFSEPWVFNRKIRLGFGLYHTESSIAEDYDESMEGLYARVGKEFLKDLEGFVTLGFQEVEISDVKSYVSQVIKDEEGTSRVSFIKNEWVYEGRDNRFFPTSGWYVRPEFTVATELLGGNEEFLKFEVEVKNHKLVFDFGDQREHVLSHRLKIGAVEPYGNSNRVGIFERFFAGGMGSVRGFANRSLGPKSNGDEVGGNFLAVYNLEYSVPINERSIRGVLFSDTGNVYKAVDDFSFSGLRTSVGVGLRLMIPALGQMPLALDFAKPIDSQDGDETETFSFNFGNFF
jgi:outer membrane protein insertion porin family